MGTVCLYGRATTVTNVVYIFYFLCYSKILIASSPLRVSRCGFVPSSIMQVNFPLHSLMQPSTRELVYIDNRWIIAVPQR